MAKLIYAAITSLDGYIEDAEGKFDWAAQDEEVDAFVNDLQRPVGTYLYGRRMYETMVFWESPPGLAEQPPVVQDFARIWQAADKIVYSKTLQTVSSARTQVVRNFDPEAVHQQKATATRDLTVGGAELAVQVIEAGLVDEFQLFLVPVVVGGGKRSLPANGVRLNLELLDERLPKRHGLPPLPQPEMKTSTVTGTGVLKSGRSTVRSRPCPPLPQLRFPRSEARSAALRSRPLLSVSGRLEPSTSLRYRTWIARGHRVIQRGIVKTCGSAVTRLETTTLLGDSP